jgi:SP family arabinose:H+ symporter-like MFS transporter
MTFPTLSRVLGQAGTQLIYAAACAFTALYVAFAVPETRGRTLEEIERSWSHKAVEGGAK